MSTLSSLSNPRVWFITGSSSGFGRALAEAVLDRGETAVLTARDTRQVEDLEAGFPGRALVVRLDVTRPDEVRSAVAKAIDAFGCIDVLLNNAGYGLLGAIEEVDDAEISRQFETNFFGALNVMQAVLPHMRGRRAGHILNISSVGGFTGYPGFGLYNGSKFALEGVSEALAQEVTPFGIRVTIVEPGAFRTDWAGRSLARAAHIIDDYAASSGTAREYMDTLDGHQQGDPARAAAAMIEVVNAAQPPLRLVLGADALERIRGKLHAVAQELDAWERTTVDTAFPAVTVHSPEYTEFQKLVQDLFAAWSTDTGKVDYDTIGRFYAKDPENVFYVPMPPLEGYMGWQNFRNGIHKNLFDSVSKFRLTANDDLRFWCKGDVAWGTFTFHFSKTTKDGRAQEFDVRMTTILERRNGRWLLVHEHASAPLTKGAAPFRTQAAPDAKTE